MVPYVKTENLKTCIASAVIKGFFDRILDILLNIFNLTSIFFRLILDRFPASHPLPKPGLLDRPKPQAQKGLLTIVFSDQFLQSVMTFYYPYEFISWTLIPELTSSVLIKYALPKPRFVKRERDL